MNRSSFLKCLLAPLLAPLLKFLPKREKPWEGTVIRSHVNGVGHFSAIAGEDLREGDLVHVRPEFTMDLAYRPKAPFCYSPNLEPFPKAGDPYVGIVRSDAFKHEAISVTPL